MKDEIKNRELTVAKTAAQHIQNLEEKYTNNLIVYFVQLINSQL